MEPMEHTTSCEIGDKFRNFTLWIPDVFPVSGSVSEAIAESLPLPDQVNSASTGQ